MLPIASNMAVRTTREHVQSAMPDAPVRPDAPKPRPRATSARLRHLLVTALRRLAGATGALADRLDRARGVTGWPSS